MNDHAYQPGQWVMFSEKHAGQVIEMMNEGTMVCVSVPERHNGKNFFCASVEGTHRLFTEENMRTEERRFSIVATELIGAYEGIYKLAMRQERKGDFDRLVALIPANYQLHKRAMLLRNWFDKPEPVGTRKMGSELSSAQQKMNNADEVAALDITKVYVLYDHARSAFWGPECGGYQYRKNAGQYSAEEAAKVISDSNRFFTAEEIPGDVLDALIQQEAMA